MKYVGRFSNKYHTKSIPIAESPVPLKKYVITENGPKNIPKISSKDSHANITKSQFLVDELLQRPGVWHAKDFEIYWAINFIDDF